MTAVQPRTVDATLRAWRRDLGSADLLQAYRDAVRAAIATITGGTS